MNQPQRTALYDRHVTLGAQIVEFGGWNMPMHYSDGIIHEHLATRNTAGLFDVSHMGRFIIRGSMAIPFLQHTLTNDAARLEVGRSHYTILPTETGGALDDGFLYRFRDDEFLLVVNAANRAADWAFLRQRQYRFDDVDLIDRTHDLAMLSLQGPRSQTILEAILGPDMLPDPRRNSTARATLRAVPVMLARTGYTGEPLCFEVIVPTEIVGELWDACCDHGAVPVGLGARDTLRLEAGLPLYGHELGTDADGAEIPVMAMATSRFAVKHAPDRPPCIGHEALAAQLSAYQEMRQDNYAHLAVLPRRVRLIAMTGKGIARAGSAVFQGDQKVGYVTSGTMVPYWHTTGDDTAWQLTEDTGKRAIGLALLDSRLQPGGSIEIEVRGRRLPAQIVSKHLDASTPPYARAIVPGARA